jgi:hypothetical protein
VSPNVKTCVTCGEPFRRPTGTNRISDVRWHNRDNCSFRCSFYHATGAGGPNPQRDEHKSRAAVACDAHLRALVRYGLKHDGLPGLPANDLLRLAAELGVAA